jgi:iron complex transport system substrate-binding protein
LLKVFVYLALKKKPVFWFGLLLSSWLTVMGSAGNRHPENPRVVSLVPHATEIMFKLGLGNLLVGRSDYCLYPPAAGKIERVGGYLNIDYEKVVRLRPDYVLQFPNGENRRKLEELDFKVVDLPNETVDQILGSIEKIGRLFSRQEKANRLVAGIRDTLNLVSHSEEEGLPVSALLVVGRQPLSLAQLFVAGPETYLSEIWEACGGTNVMMNGPARYFAVNEEDLLKKEVNIILEFHPDWDFTTDRIRKEREVWSLFGNLVAVKQNEIHFLSDRFYLIPGPRISFIAIKFHEMIRNYQNKRK